MKHDIGTVGVKNESEWAGLQVESVTSNWTQFWKKKENT